MAGETFYTYLHGPRTFWGNSGSNIRINNNFGFPCTPPMMSGCGCGGGSNNIWSTMMMLNSMMAQTLPYWNFSKPEGAGDSSAPGSTTPLDKLTTARQTLDQIGFTQAAGYSLYLDESGNIIYRYSKDGKEYSASSMADLTAKITAGATEGRGGSDSEILADDSIISVDDDSSVSVDEDDGDIDVTSDVSDVDDTEDTVDNNLTEGAGNSTATRKFKRGKLNKGWEWTTYAKLQNGDLKNKIADKNCKTAVDILKAIYPNWADKSVEEIKGSSSYKFLMDVNPGAIDNNGKIVNKNKLDLFVRTESKGNASAHKITNKNGYALERTASGSYIYTHNGQTVTAAQFAKACPQTFINEHNKKWTADTILAALTAFDSIKLAKYPNSGKGYLSSVTAKTTNDKSRVGIVANYKGNGLLNNWKYTMSYTDLKNGVIALDISKIYEDVTQGYNRIGD